MATITANVGSFSWNTVSTATWDGGVIPTAADDVIIPSGATIVATSGSGSVCRSLTVQDGGSLGWSTTSINISIGDASGGALTIEPSATLTGATGIITFVSTSNNGGAGWPITTNGKTLPNVTFNGVGGKWTLQDALTCPVLTVTAGHFDSGSQNISCTRFLSSNNNVRTISLGSSIVSLTNDADLSSVGNLTWTANTAILRFGTQNGISSGNQFDYQGLSLEYTAIGSVGATLFGAGVFKDLTAVGAAPSAFLQLNNNPVFTGTVSLSGNSPTNRLLVQSNTLGTTRVITAAATSLTDVDFMDIAIVGPTGSTITSDSFNRADGALVGSTSDAAAGGTGVVWAGSDGTWSIASNKASRSGSAYYSFAVVETGTSDQWVQTTYQSGTIGLVARYTDAANCIFVRYSGSSSGLTVLRGGVIVYIAGLPGPHNTAVAGDVITLAVNGNVVRVMKNGNIVYWSVPQYTTVLRQAESTLSGTKAGLATNLPVGASDDFIVKDLPNVTGTRLGDCLGNSGIEFTTASGTPRDGGGAGVKRYAVAAGNFSSTAMWSETSGGAPGASVPLPQDDVYLDANSAAGTYAVNVPRMGRNIDATGFTRTINHGAISTTALYGSLTRGSGGTYTEVAGNIDFRGRGSHTVTMTANVASNLNFWSGTYTLLSGFSASGAYNNAVTLSGGTLDLNGQTLNLVNLQTSGTLTKTLIFGAATINMIGSLANIFNLDHANNTVSAEAATINISAVFAADRNFWGGNNEFGALNYTVSDSPGALVISNSNTFGTLNIGSGRSLRLTSGTTQKIGTLNLNGVPRGGVRLPGVGGTYLSTPDSAAVSVTGDIDIRVRVALTDWTPGASQALIGKYVSTANQGSYILAIDTGGRPNFLVSDSGGGGSWVYVGGAAWVDGTTYWVRVTHTMAGLLRFFYAADSSTMPTSWTQLGSDQTAFTYGKYDSTAPLEIGSYGNGVSMKAVGTFYRAQIRNNVLDDGSGIVFDTDLTNQFGPYYTDSANGAIVTPSTSLANVGDGRVVIESATAGSAATLQVDTVTDMNYVDLKDVVMNGADTYIGATSVIRSNVKGVRRGPKTGLGV